MMMKMENGGEQNNEKTGLEVGSESTFTSDASQPTQLSSTATSISTPPDIASVSHPKRAKIYAATVIVVLIAVSALYLVISTHISLSTPSTVTGTKFTSTILPTNSSASNTKIRINYTKVPSLESYVNQDLINVTPTGQSMVLLYNYSFVQPVAPNSFGYSQQYSLKPFEKIMSNNFTNVSYDEIIPAIYENSTYPLAIALFVYQFNNSAEANAYYNSNRASLESLSTMHIGDSVVNIMFSNLSFGDGYAGIERPEFHTMENSFVTFIYKNYVGYVSVFGTLNDYNVSYTYKIAKSMYGSFSGGKLST